MPHPTPSPEGLRHDYESTLLSIAELKAKYALTDDALRIFRTTEGWTTRDNSPSALKAYALARRVKKLDLTGDTDQADAAPPPPDSPDPPAKPRRAPAIPSGGKPAHRKGLIRRLYDFIDVKLAELESRAATRTKLSAADSEREFKAVTSIIKAIEQLKDVSDADTRTTATDTIDTPSHDDAERLRQNLVERFAKLCGPVADQPPAGGSVAA